MPIKKNLRNAMVVCVLLISSGLGWSEDQKTKEPPKKPAPVANQPRPVAPQRVQRTPPPAASVRPGNPGGNPPGVGRTNPNVRTTVDNPNPRTGDVNPYGRRGAGNPNTPTGVANPNPRTDDVNPYGRRGTGNPNAPTGVANPNPRTGDVNPYGRRGPGNPNAPTGVANPNPRTGDVNPYGRRGPGNPNAPTGVANPNPRPGVVNPNPRTGADAYRGGRPGGPMGKPNPTHVVPTRGGGRMEVDSHNRVTQFHGKDGQEAKFGARGQIREFHDPKRNLTVERGLRRNDTRITSERNGRRVVSVGPNRGYTERAYLNRNGHTYYQRTYLVGGQHYARVYRDHYYNGVHYFGYVPVYRYRPAFYVWAYNPWPRPIIYDWGWGPSPVFFGVYFTPAPSYLTASLWLTDFLLAENLREAYEARREAEARAEADRYNEPPPESEIRNPDEIRMSAEVKVMIDAEVKRQLEEERVKAETPEVNPTAEPEGVPPPALDPTQRLFVVSGNLGVATGDGQECELTPGDVITRLDDAPGEDGKVRVSVMSSQQNDCRVGATPRVAVTDLQEMHNSFREKLDSGLKKLADNSGRAGLPVAPDAQPIAGEVPPPAPDRTVDRQLAEQQKEASETEAQVNQEVGTGQGGATQQ